MIERPDEPSQELIHYSVEEIINEAETRLLTAKEILNMISISRTSLWNHKKKGLPCLYFKGYPLYRVEDIIEYFNIHLEQRK